VINRHIPRDGHDPNVQASFARVELPGSIPQAQKKFLQQVFGSELVVCDADQKSERRTAVLVVSGRETFRFTVAELFYDSRFVAILGVHARKSKAY
jgi:hypothetical protein